MRSKVFRNFALSFLILSLLTGSVSFTFAASYTDIESTPFQEAVNLLSDKGVIDGYPDGTYQPSRNVIRAEFSAMLVKLLGVSDQSLASYTKTNFKDMTGFGWATPYIGYCADKGIINGDGHGNAMPGSKITYTQAITMVVRALGLESELDSKLSWPENYIDVATKHGLTKNLSLDAGNVNRGYAAILLYNALNNNSTYSGKLSVDDLSTYRNVQGKLVQSDKFGRNIDTEIAVKFTLKHDKVESDRTVPIQIQILPAVEKKVIEKEIKYIKILKNTNTTEVSTTISIKNLVKDNYSVSQYKIEIKANDLVLDVSSLDLIIDTAEQEALINNCTVKSMKFYSNNSQEPLDYGKREYAESFLKTPFLALMCTDLLLEHEKLSKDMVIPITSKYYCYGDQYGEVKYNYTFEKGTTSTLIESGIYYTKFDVGKYPAGNYTVKVYAFDKLIAEGKFSIVN